jgi:hypothetical protein
LAHFAFPAKDEGFAVLVDFNGRRAAVIIAEVALATDVNCAGYS